VIDIRIVDPEVVLNAIKNLPGKIMTNVRRFMTAEGAKIESEVKQSMKSGGGGRAKGSNRARSLPYQPPYVQTGRLRASIGYKVEQSGYQVDLAVGTTRDTADVRYARYLEFGTRKMIQRPFLVPVVKKHVAGLKGGIAAAVRVV